MTASRTVYTCLFGEYERLSEQPVAASSAIPFRALCDAEQGSASWAVERVARVRGDDPARSSRHPKILPYDYLPGVEASLYIDNSVRLLQDPTPLFERFLASGADIALNRHTLHGALWQEFVAVQRLSYEDPKVLASLLENLARDRPELLDAPVWWGGMILRRHDRPQVEAAMRDWWDHVLLLSRRDQLTLPMVLSDHGLRVFDLGLGNEESEYHQWPVVEGRKRSREERGGIRDPYLLTVLTRLADARDEGDRLRAQVEVAAQRERALVGEQERLEHELGIARSALDDVVSSPSWALTRPLRWGKARLRRSAPG